LFTEESESVRGYRPNIECLMDAEGLSKVTADSHVRCKSDNISQRNDRNDYVLSNNAISDDVYDLQIHSDFYKSFNFSYPSACSS